MKPMAMDAIQMTQDSLPTVAATAPMENSTKGGTPLATQKAPVQSMPRSKPALLAAVSTMAASAVELILCTPCRVQRGRRDLRLFQLSHSYAALLNIFGRGRPDPVNPREAHKYAVIHRQPQRRLPRCHIWPPQKS